jgi:hypothetical protein
MNPVQFNIIPEVCASHHNLATVPSWLSTLCIPCSNINSHNTLKFRFETERTELYYILLTLFISLNMKWFSLDRDFVMYTIHHIELLTLFPLYLELYCYLSGFVLLCIQISVYLYLASQINK